MTLEEKTYYGKQYIDYLNDCEFDVIKNIKFVSQTKRSMHFKSDELKIIIPKKSVFKYYRHMTNTEVALKV